MKKPETIAELADYIREQELTNPQAYVLLWSVLGSLEHLAKTADPVAVSACVQTLFPVIPQNK